MDFFPLCDQSSWASYRTETFIRVRIMKMKQHNNTCCSATLLSQTFICSFLACNLDSSVLLCARYYKETFTIHPHGCDNTICAQFCNKMETEDVRFVNNQTYIYLINTEMCLERWVIELKLAAHMLCSLSSTWFNSRACEEMPCHPLFPPFQTVSPIKAPSGPEHITLYL